MNEITFNTSAEFHAFVLFAVKNGLRYTAEENDSVIVVVVTGY